MSIGRSRERALFHDDRLPLPVEIRPIRSARRLRLRFDDRRNLLTLTGPAGMNRPAALAWAVEQRDWVDAQIETKPRAEPFAPGANVPVDGIETQLVWSITHPRTPRLDDAEGGRSLQCGGPRDGLERRVEAWLRRRALETLSRETAEIASIAGLRVGAVSVGDAATRWGSCSSTGRIRYNWRLILAPAAVRRLVVAHEVAHVRHLNHGLEFKALERRLFGGDVAAARLLLRTLGPRLRRFGRGH